MFDRYVVFSSHAKERIRQLNLSLAKANWLLYTGTEDELDKNMSKYKSQKYTDHARYYRNGPLLFTLIPQVDKHIGDPIYLVVSVYDQRLDLK